MLKTSNAAALEAPRTVNAAVNSASFKLPGGTDSLTIVLVISSASSPTGCTAQLAGSLDNVAFIPIGTATAISANGPLPFTQDRPPYLYYQIQYARSGGSFISTSTVVTKGDR